jgi:hypothetical protein
VIRIVEPFKAELDLSDATPDAAASSVTTFLAPIFTGLRGLRWEPERRSWSAED